MVGAGSYKCRNCGLRIGLDGHEEVPPCPACGGTRFRRAPLFEPATAMGEQRTLERRLSRTPARSLRGSPDAGGLADGGRYLVSRSGHRIRRRAAGGRLVTNRPQRNDDIRVDDPTVSTRHALVVRTAGGEVRVLDDRSLNGVS